MRKYLLLAASLLLATPALADWTGKDASGATITFKNTGTCSSVVCVPIAQPVDGTGAAFGVTGNPFFMSFASGVTLPGFTSTPTFNLGTLNGAATAVKQPALGTAGTPSADVISVQGVSGGTPQPISVASAAIQPGAFGVGALPNGASTAQGSTTDAPCTLPATTTACSQVAIEKAGANALNSLGAISQATPGTTNGVAIVGVNGATALAGNGQTGAGAQRVTLSQDSLSVPINVSTATTTQLVALSGSTSIYVTSYDVLAAGTGNITFEYGTGTACATGTTALTGAYNLTAQAGIAKGAGIGAVLKVPSGNALCVLTSAAVQMSGSLSYIQF